jgi:hypothetical protein
LTYLYNCIKNDGYATQRKLFVSGSLLTQFRELHNRSESEGIEYGVNLYRKLTTSSSLTLNTKDQILIGGNNGTTVDLKTKDVHNEHDYIGDCHTHPYLLKMGKNIQIGPSIGDYKEWWLHRPNAFNVAVHFVLSNGCIFLLFTRKATIPTFDENNLPLVDNRRFNDFFITNDELNKAFLTAGDLKMSNYVKGLTAERDAFAQYEPTAPKILMQDNREMNKQLATDLKFEYYSGNLDNDSKSTSCTLELATPMVYV